MSVNNNLECLNLTALSTSFFGSEFRRHDSNAEREIFNDRQGWWSFSKSALFKINPNTTAQFYLPDWN